MSAVAESLREGAMQEGMQVARQIAALPESAMRASVLAERLDEAGPLRAVWLLEGLIRGALAKEPSCVATYECLIEPKDVQDELSESYLSQMIAAGTDERCVAAVQWLRSVGVALSQRPVHAPEEGNGRPVAPELRDLTLGDRRSRARRVKEEQLRAMLGDPDPGVVTNLLNNPRITEQMVLSVASRRPTSAAALQAVRESRWGSRYTVKLALVQNPFLDLRLGINLLVCLSNNDLTAVQRDHSLAGTLRLAAQRLLDLAREGR